jgi:hypothetical protein
MRASALTLAYEKHEKEKKSRWKRYRESQYRLHMMDREEQTIEDKEKGDQDGSSQSTSL